jgi:uncharacterized spore protein YtfJ
MTIEDDSTIASVLEHLRGTRDAISVRRVFGEPYVLDGVTVIPVARVAGGGGGGGGTGSREQGEGSGAGTGFGMTAKGIGVYEVRDGHVAWRPAVDATQLAKGGQVLAGIVAVCITLLLLRR